MLSNNQILGLFFLGCAIFWFGFFVRGIYDEAIERIRIRKMIEEQERKRPKATIANKILSSRKVSK